jgi:hypothetical protein
MSLAAAGTLEDLGALTFGDHALELQQQLIFRRVRPRQFEEYRFNAHRENLQSAERRESDARHGAE